MFYIRGILAENITCALPSATLASGIWLFSPDDEESLRISSTTVMEQQVIEVK